MFFRDLSELLKLTYLNPLIGSKGIRNLRPQVFLITNCLPQKLLEKYFGKLHEQQLNDRQN